MSLRADDSDADEASEHADESAGPRIARRIWGPVTKDVSESMRDSARIHVNHLVIYLSSLVDFLIKKSIVPLKKERRT